MPPPMQGYKTEDYNENGDRTMARVYIQAKFDNLNDTLSAAKAKTDYLKSAPKISSKNSQGPVPNASQQWKKNVFTSQPNSKKYDMIRRNIDATPKKDEDFWKLFDLNDAEQTMTQNPQGPINPNAYDSDEVDFDENDFLNKNTK